MKKYIWTTLYDGTCPRCGSSNTWSDETMWGCNSCGGIFSNQMNLIETAFYIGIVFISAALVTATILAWMGLGVLV